MKLLLRLVIFALLLTAGLGCAPRKIPIERPPEAVWNHFQSDLNIFSPDQSFLINSSVTYITPDQRNRIQATLWGFTNYPIRMDLRAGLGQYVAMWYEDENVWEAYFPGENIKYVHHDGSMGASILGYATVFDLKRTAMIMLGSFAGIIPRDYCKVASYNGKWKFFFQDHSVRSLVLNQDGSVHSLEGQNWKVDFSARRQGDKFSYFSRLDMQVSRDEALLIRIRSIAVDQDWDEKQLLLEIPQDAEVLHLSNY